MDLSNCDSPFTIFCLTSLSPISDISYIPITPFQEKINHIIQIPIKRVSESTMCNCKKSQCKKAYCECFSKGKYCEDCGCNGCLNFPNANNKKDIQVQKKKCSCKRINNNKNTCKCYEKRKKNLENIQM